MCVVEVTRVKNLKQLLNYLESEQGHNGNEKRNNITANINMAGSDVYSQMKMIWEKNGQAKVEALHIIQSFSKNELSPDDPNSSLIANQIGQDLANTLYKDFQCKVYTQMDGIGGMVHNHLVINNVNMFDFTAMKNAQYKVQNVRNVSDEIVKQNGIDFDYGQERSDITNQAEQNKRKSNKYVWKDDLKERIQNVLSDEYFTNHDEYAAALKQRGVLCEFRHTKTRDYVLYELDENVIPTCEKVQRNRRSKSYKLGSNYDLFKIDSVMHENHLKQAVNGIQISDWMLQDIQRRLQDEQTIQNDEFDIENVMKEDEKLADEFQHREDAQDAQKRVNSEHVKNVLDDVQKRENKTNRSIPTAFEDVYEKDLQNQNFIYDGREK